MASSSHDKSTNMATFTKSLLGFNVAVGLGGVLLYLAGVRVAVDFDHEVAKPLVERVSSFVSPFSNASSPVATPSPQAAVGEKPNTTNYTCSHSEMNPKFLSYDPIMVYIENFITPFERAYLLDTAREKYEHSTVDYGNDDPNGEVEEVIDPDTRRSESSWLNQGDAVVDCVRARALEFQGFAPNEMMQDLAALRYSVGGAFETHFDWHAARPKPIDRITSFFATLAVSDDLVGGATWFPDVVAPAWKDLAPWCARGWLDCSYDEGLAFRPIPGNAVFWVNFHSDGTGHRSTAHAGEPVIQGSKIGLNVWTDGQVNDWYFEDEAQFEEAEAQADGAPVDAAQADEAKMAEPETKKADASGGDEADGASQSAQAPLVKPPTPIVASGSHDEQ